MPVTVEQSGGMRFIRLEGEVNIASASELKKLLLEALAADGEVRVDLERAAELDVTAWQLLWAGEREARACGKGFSVAGQVPEEVLLSMGEAGWNTFPVSGEAKAEEK